MKNRLLSLVLLLFTAFGVGGQVPSYVPTNGLVGYWPFNGNANDESGNGNNGTVNGAKLTADRFGNINQAYLFDGINDEITYESGTSCNLNIIGDISISFFLRTTQNTTGIMISFGEHNGTEGGYLAALNIGNINQEGPFGFHSTGPWVFSNDSINNNYWHSIIVVQKNDTVSIFINGLLNNQLNGISPLSSWNGERKLGVRNDISMEYYDGELDDLGIWNRALTADEVLALYNGCNVTPQTISGNTTPSAFSNSTYTCNNNAGSTYAWTVSNGVIASGQGTNTIDVLWGAEGVGGVAVTETTADGCVGDTVSYDVNVQCVVSGNAITGPVGPEAFSSSTYTCNGATNSTYNWTVTNGVIASGQGTNTVNILWASTGLGNVSVVETTAEGCVGTTLSQDVVVIPVSVEELSNALILYPNPVTTELNLQTTSDLIGTDFFIFDALGKQIMKQQILSTNTTINTSAFAAGNYVVKVGGVVKRFEVVR